MDIYGSGSEATDDDMVQAELDAILARCAEKGRRYSSSSSNDSPSGGEDISEENSSTSAESASSVGDPVTFGSDDAANKTKNLLRLIVYRDPRIRASQPLARPSTFLDDLLCDPSAYTKYQRKLFELAMGVDAFETRIGRPPDEKPFTEPGVLSDGWRDWVVKRNRFLG